MSEKLIIFDLDGVILDSKSNMRESWKKVCEKLKLKVSFNEYFKKIGLPFSKILSELNIKNNIKLAEKIYREESIKNFKLIKLYPTVAETLKFLKKKKFKIGIITSKEKIRTLKLIKRFKLKFDFVICPEKGKPGKPNPYLLNKLKKTYKIKKKSIYYLGDTIIDYKFAKNSKINFIFCKYGYGKMNKKTTEFKKFNEIIQYLNI